MELPGRGLKKYRNVTFHVLGRGAGKATFTKRYDEYLAVIGEVINQAPGKVLVVYYKDFGRFREDSGLPFRPHAKFEKADLDARQELYRKIAEQIWNPENLLREVDA